MKRLAHQLGDSRRIVDLHDPLAQRLEEPPVVDLLERLAVGMPALDLTDEHHHRRRVLRGGVEPDRRVAGARPTGDHDHAGPPGELAVGFRHVGGATLVPTGDGRDRAARIVQCVERREVALARHAEDGVDAVNCEGVDQDAAAGATIALRHVRHRACANRGGRGSSHGTHGPRQYAQSEFASRRAPADLDRAVCGPCPGPDGGAGFGGHRRLKRF